MKNTTEMFLEQFELNDIKHEETKEIYKRYCEWCDKNKYFKFLQTGLTRAIKARYNLKVIRRRVNTKLVSFYGELCE